MKDERCSVVCGRADGGLLFDECGLPKEAAHKGSFLFAYAGRVAIR